MATSEKLNCLTCNICMEVSRQPSTLSCQHTFCQGCLTSYIKTQTDAVKTSSIPCPTCRQETPVPQPDRPVEEWAGQMKPGPLVTDILDSDVLGNTEHCFMCKEEGEATPATHWCSECEASFCDGCLKLHRKVPTSRHHDTIPLSEETPQTQLKKKYVCFEHGVKIKVFCRDCNKPLCTICCNSNHRSCKNVVTLQSMLLEVKQDLQNRQMKLTEDINNKSKKVAEDKNKIKAVFVETPEIQLEIKQVTKSIVDLLHQKEIELMKKLNDITEQQTSHLQARVKSGEMEIQMYQQQAQFIQQTLKLDDEAQLFKVFLSGSGAVADVTDKQRDEWKDGTVISFVHDLETLKEAIDKVDVKTVDDFIDLTASPVLHEVIDTGCTVSDLVVMRMKDMKVTVITDPGKHSVKSFYTQCGKQWSSELKVDHAPRSVSVLSQNKVVVSVPFSNQILTVGVNPELKLLSTITTQKEYHGLAVLDELTLVAHSTRPQSVDVLDMAGRVVKTICASQTCMHLSASMYLHVTSQGNIIISNWDLLPVSCLTPTGQVVFTYKPTGDRALKYPCGITSTPTGDILVTDNIAHKVIQISKSGQFIKDILTSQDGLQDPVSLCVDGDRLYVATVQRGVLMFKFGCPTFRPTTCPPHDLSAPPIAPPFQPPHFFNPQRFAPPFGPNVLPQRSAPPFCPNILPQRFAPPSCPNVLPQRFAPPFGPNVLPQRFAPPFDPTFSPHLFDPNAKIN